MDVRRIRNEEDYTWALKEVEAYFDNEPALGTAEAERFEVLTSLISDYEKQAVRIKKADPIDVLQFVISNMGRSQTELGDLLGSRSRASEILNRKRRLNLEQIRAISAAWHLPIEVLAGSYELDPPVTVSRDMREQEFA